MNAENTNPQDPQEDKSQDEAKAPETTPADSADSKPGDTSTADDVENKGSGKDEGKSGESSSQESQESQEAQKTQATPVEQETSAAPATPAGQEIPETQFGQEPSETQAIRPSDPKAILNELDKESQQEQDQKGHPSAAGAPEELESPQESSSETDEPMELVSDAMKRLDALLDKIKQEQSDTSSDTKPEE